MKKIEYREATEEERGISSIQLRVLDNRGMIVYDRDVVQIDQMAMAAAVYAPCD